jgi:dTDP-4-dehydrorhamnose reductase
VRSVVPEARVGLRSGAVRILLLGADGQVGYELRGALAPFAEVVAAGRGTVDLGDLAGLRAFVDATRPHAIVNAASFNDVDGAERDEEAARRANAEAVGVLGEVAKKLRAALVHYSTDFVFDGRKGAPYVETDAPAPLGAYGRSKLAGEHALAELAAPAIVLRTAWVYSLRRKSFVSVILRAAREREALRVVSDQVGCPTWCRDLAVATALLLYGARADLHGAFDGARGVYHLAGSGAASRYELAQAAIELDPRKGEHKVKTVEPVPSSAYPLPAARPAFAPLDCEKLRARFGISLPPWRDSLGRALEAAS